MTDTCRKCRQALTTLTTRGKRSLCQGCRQRQSRYDRAFYTRKKADRSFQIWKRTRRKELNKLGKYAATRVKLWNQSEVEHIVTNIWNGRCALTGSSEDLVLCRWFNEEQLSLSNHVCLCSPLARKHSYVNDPDAYYGSSFSSPITAKLGPYMKSNTLEQHKHDDDCSDYTGGS
jgi:hypothetical protein